MSIKSVLVKIGNIWSAIKWIGRKIHIAVKYISYILELWFLRTKCKISRVYLVYACLMSGSIGFGKSIKSQYGVWKVDRKDILNPQPANREDMEVL